MIADTLWTTAFIAGPVLLVAALVFALIKNRRMSAIDRSDLREAVDDLYDDADTDDGPVRVDIERKQKVDMRPPTRAAVRRPSRIQPASRWSHG